MNKRAKRIVIVGAGGHARVIADAILAMATKSDDIELIGFLDDNADLVGDHMSRWQILGSTDDLDRIDHDSIVIGIGDNRIRERLFTDLSARGEHFCSIIHPQAVIAVDVPIGVGTVVFGGVVVNTGSRIGDNVILNTSCSVDHDCIVGSHSHICPGVHLGGTVSVGEGAWIGIASTVLQNRTVGSWSVVGGGAAVIRDVDPHVTVVGVPARPIHTTKISHRSEGRPFSIGIDATTIHAKAPDPLIRDSSQKGMLDGQRVAIYGAGGLGREVAAAIQFAVGRSKFEVVSFVDDDPELHGNKIAGIPVRHLEQVCDEFPKVKILCAISEPELRSRAVAHARSLCMEFASFVDKSVDLDPSIRMGEGCIIAKGCILTTDISLGDFVIINLQSTLGHDTTVGDYCTIGPGVRVGGYVAIGKKAKVNMGALIVNGLAGKPIVIGDSAQVGMGSCVLSSVRSGCTVFGSPARVVPVIAEH